MFSPVKAMTAGALVLAIGGAFLIAQPFDQQGSDPGAEQRATGEVVAGEVVAGLSVGTGVRVTQDCAIASTPVRCDWTASDPRLTGTMTHEWAGEVFATEEDPSVSWAPATLEGPEGDWAGHLYAVWTDPAQLLVMLSGDGAYDGWQYVAATIDSEASPGDSEWVGMLYEDELPPVGPPAE